MQMDSFIVCFSIWHFDVDHVTMVKVFLGEKMELFSFRPCTRTTIENDGRDLRSAGGDHSESPLMISATIGMNACPALTIHRARVCTIDESIISRLDSKLLRTPKNCSIREAIERSDGDFRQKGHQSSSRCTLFKRVHILKVTQQFC